MPESIDLRKCLNAISDVVTNRPRPIREFDQIYMKTADMLLQVEHIGKWFDGKRIVFIGDGDAISLCSVHLHHKKLLKHGPKAVHVLDFDERIVSSIKQFAKQFGIQKKITAELYNVADALPKAYWQAFEGFHTNPPFGASNGGNSVEAFLTRGIEAVGENAIGCLVVADCRTLHWTQQVLHNTEQVVLQQGFVINEVIPEFHQYHLDDTPELTSCSIIIKRLEWKATLYNSQALNRSMFTDFYGKGRSLTVKYVRDLTSGGKRPSLDHKLELLEGDNKKDAN